MGLGHWRPCRKSLFGVPLVYEGMREMHERVGAFNEEASNTAIGESRRGSVFIVLEHPWSDIMASEDEEKPDRRALGGHMSVFIDLDGNSIRDENGKIVQLAGLQFTLSADPIYRAVWYNKALRYTRRACVDKLVWTDAKPFIVAESAQVWELADALDPFGIEQFAQPNSWQSAFLSNQQIAAFEKDLVEAINNREEAIPTIRARVGKSEHDLAYVDRLDAFVRQLPRIRGYDLAKVEEAVTRSWPRMKAVVKERAGSRRQNDFFVSLKAFLEALRHPFDYEPPTTSELDVWTMGQRFSSFTYTKALVTVLLSQHWPKELDVLIEQQDWAESFVNTAIMSKDGIWDY